MRLDQPEVGEAILLLRKECHLTSARLVECMWELHGGDDLGVDPSRIYRWEKQKGRRRPRPDPLYRRLLGLVCAREVQKLSPIRRREFLQRLAALADPPLLPGFPAVDPDLKAHIGPPDRELLDGMAALTRCCLRLHNTVAPSAVRLTIVRHLGDLMTLAAQSPSSSISARIGTMAAQTAILAGWVSFNLRDADQARTHWTTAHELARQAGNVSLQAHALGCRSRLYSPIHRGPDDADPVTALALLDHAVQLADQAATPALRSWLLANRAQQLAATDQPDASQRDLDAAARLAALHEQSDDDVLSGWDEVRVDAYRGICALVLERPADVIAITQPVLARTEPSRVQRSLQQCDLAAAYALQDDVDHACSLLGEALGAASQAHFLEGVQRAVGVRSKYIGDRRSQSVQEIDELIAAVAA